jgi:hypothetical protein
MGFVLVQADADATNDGPIICHFAREQRNDFSADATSG